MYHKNVTTFSTSTCTIPSQENFSAILSWCSDLSLNSAHSNLRPFTFLASVLENRLKNYLVPAVFSASYYMNLLSVSLQTSFLPLWTITKNFQDPIYKWPRKGACQPLFKLGDNNVFRYTFPASAKKEQNFSSQWVEEGCRWLSHSFALSAASFRGRQALLRAESRTHADKLSLLPIWNSTDTLQIGPMKDLIRTMMVKILAGLCYSTFHYSTQSLDMGEREKHVTRLLKSVVSQLPWWPSIKI